MDFVLKNLQWHNGTEIISGDIHIKDDLIADIGKNLSHSVNVDFEGHYVYPGLINAHDHLEMNLYPKLGNPPYENYIQWSNDIYKSDESPVREIEKVPIEDRLLWGGLKNLISGATRVVHHNPWNSIFTRNDYPVKVLKTEWAHSLAFGKEQLKNLLKIKTPFVIHAAEGVDDYVLGEIQQLESLGLINSNTVLIHAIALSGEGQELLHRMNASVVWCPASNYFMFSKTADIPDLKKKIRVSLGSDSTMTGSPTLLHEIKAAHETGFASEKEIFEMVTKNAADIFQLTIPSIKNNSTADLFIAPIIKNDYHSNLVDLPLEKIKLVITNGKPQLIDSDLKNPFKELKYPIRINNITKLTATDFQEVRKRILKKVGRSILESNELWNVLND